MNSPTRSATPADPLGGGGRFVVPRQEFVPAYVRLLAEGALAERARGARALLAQCRLCPRACGVNRLENQVGVCRSGARATVSSAFAHHGEEACLRGRRGSGTIFFAWCNLRCVFCQNFELSHLGEGREVDAAELADLMLRLQAAGCHNINLVTPSHVVTQVLEALLAAAQAGLRLPLVYNSGGYDSVETLRLLDGVVDIYMPDFKFWSEAAAARYLRAPDYPAVARDALREMHRQVGVLRVDEAGLALRGLLVRHLVMPGLPEETRQITHWLATELSPDTYVNLMAQYRPAGLVGVNGRYAELQRPLQPAEYGAAWDAARAVGLWRLDEPF